MAIASFSEKAIGGSTRSLRTWYPPAAPTSEYNGKPTSSRACKSLNMVLLDTENSSANSPTVKCLLEFIVIIIAMSRSVFDIFNSFPE